MPTLTFNHLGPFEAEVTQLYDHLMQSAFAEDDADIIAHPQYVDQGAECFVFRLGDTRHLAKFPLVSWLDIPAEDRYPNPGDNEIVMDESFYLFDIRIEALQRGIGAAGLEQIVAYNVIETPCVVVEAIPTHPSSTLYDQRYSVQEYHTLLNAFDSAQDHNVTIDAIAGNFLYNPQSGFHIIDYILPLPDHSLGHTISNFGSAEILNPAANPANARAYHQACREHYGAATADALAQSWQKIPGAEHII